MNRPSNPIPSLVASAALAVVLAASGLLAAPGATPAQAARPFGVNVLSSSMYADSLGIVHVVGEVANDTRLPVEFVRITADFYDASGTLVATDFTYSRLDVLDPGERSPFHVISFSAAGATSYRLRTAYRPTLTPANHYFTVAVTNETPGPLGMLSLVGTVTNRNTTAAEFVRVEATFYDAAGVVVGTDFSYVNTDDRATLAAGETASFEIVVFDPPAYARYEVVATGRGTPALPTTLTASPTVVTYGTPVVLRGRAEPDAPITFERWDLATSAWQPLPIAATADATGAFGASLKATSTGFVRARSPLSPSVPAIYRIRSLVTLKASASIVGRGTPVILSGLVRPLFPGKRVVIQRLVYGVWRTFTTVTLDSTSAFRYRWVPRTAGTYVFRAVVGAQLDVLANVSLSRRVIVR
ncbi:MAG TPA: DUF3426 domain-containing protein [Candidatus Limnocylindrales bacterium]|jgi:hypothetical protein|nr:DUF3426 domain-containing protein [Candidatus Limnocylindrales bacterium]